MTFRNREPFFVQENPRGVWHVETPDDPEEMLCGERISVEGAMVRVQTSWGVKPCPWCRHKLESILLRDQFSSRSDPRLTSTSRARGTGPSPGSMTGTGRGES